ncbi:MAG: SRPBCC domain-containing protein [Solirubrobacterales bacterium]|nr:SRPBCC domain-containing protein [Solirubrobacterales bacterium]
MAEPDPFGIGGFATRRVFAAVRDRVWREWTEPERFADWFGGVQCEVPLATVSMDVRPGGGFRVTMFCGPERRMIRWAGEYHEVIAPERLVFTITDQPGGDSYELVTVQLSDLGDGRTEMHFEQRGHMRPDEYDHAKSGWGAFFARLDERLAGAS